MRWARSRSGLAAFMRMNVGRQARGCNPPSQSPPVIEDDVLVPDGDAGRDQVANGADDFVWLHVATGIVVFANDENQVKPHRRKRSMIASRSSGERLLGVGWNL